MENLEVKNEQGETVLPKSQYNFLEPVNGAVYVEDDEFEKLKSGKPAEETPAPQDTPEANTGGDFADPPASTPPAEIDYNAILKEKTGGKFENWDDVLKIAEAKDARVPAGISEENEDQYFEVLYKRNVLRNVDKLDDANAVKLKMQWDNPDWTPEDVEDEFTDKYGVTVDKDDEPEEYAKQERRILRKLAAEAKTARADLAAQKETLKFPEPVQQTDPEMEAFVTDFNKFGEQYASGLKNIQNLKALDLSVADEDVQFKHEYSIEDSERQDISSKAKDYWQYIESRYAKDGKFDTQKLFEDIFFLENRGKIIKSAVTRAMNLAKVELVKGVANVQDGKVPIPITDLAAQEALEAKKRFILA